MSDICPACNYQMYIQLPCLQLLFLIYPFKGSSPVPVRSVPANQGKNETGKQGNCNTIAVLQIDSVGLLWYNSGDNYARIVERFVFIRMVSGRTLLLIKSR